MRRRLLVLAYDRIGPRMAGPGIRSFEIACALARTAPVTLATQYALTRPGPGLTVARYDEDAELARLLREHDAVLTHGYTLLHSAALRDADVMRIVDLYDPFLLSNLAIHAGRPPAEGDDPLVLDVAVQNELLDAGDYFVCASERQRDYWLGALSTRGRITLEAFREDSELRNLIDLVPYGCPDEPPQQAAPVLKGVHPDIPEDAFLVVWSGGMWQWFDPVLAVDAFARLLDDVPQARLYLLGLELAGRDVPPQQAAADTLARSRALGLLGSSVLVGDWVPYDERGRYLLEADAALVVTRPSIESRLAFRSRMIDHFWAGLPTVTTGGDELADRAERAGAALVAEPRAEAIAAALARLALAADERACVSAAAAAFAPAFAWSRVVEPLERLLAGRVVPPPRSRTQVDDSSAVALHRDRLRRDVKVLARELAGVRDDRATIATELDAVRADRAQVLGRNADLEAALKAMHRSLSWRLTRPLRAIRNHLPG